jgi:hypothetical protein
MGIYIYKLELDFFVWLVCWQLLPSFAMIYFVGDA